MSLAGQDVSLPGQKLAKLATDAIYSGFNEKLAESHPNGLPPAGNPHHNLRATYQFSSGAGKRWQESNASGKFVD